MKKKVKKHIACIANILEMLILAPVILAKIIMDPIQGRLSVKIEYGIY